MRTHREQFRICKHEGLTGVSEETVTLFAKRSNTHPNSMEVKLTACKRFGGVCSSSHKDCLKFRQNKQ